MKESHRQTKLLRFQHISNDIQSSRTLLLLHFKAQTFQFLNTTQSQKTQPFKYHRTYLAYPCIHQSTLTQEKLQIELNGFYRLEQTPKIPCWSAVTREQKANSLLKSCSELTLPPSHSTKRQTVQSESIQVIQSPISCQWHRASRTLPKTIETSGQDKETTFLLRNYRRVAEKSAEDFKSMNWLNCDKAAAVQ